jgi:hypothetical protein
MRLNVHSPWELTSGFFFIQVTCIILTQLHGVLSLNTEPMRILNSKLVMTQLSELVGQEHGYFCLLCQSSIPITAA